MSYTLVYVFSYTLMYSYVYTCLLSSYVLEFLNLVICCEHSLLTPVFSWPGMWWIQRTVYPRTSEHVEYTELDINSLQGTMHTITPRGRLKSQIHVRVCFWQGGNWRTLWNFIQMWGEHVIFHSDSKLRIELEMLELWGGISTYCVVV